MKSGVWHQFGHNSQKLALEQVQLENGVGIVFSPRDLSFQLAIKYANLFHGLGSDILIDLQFYNQQFQNKNLATYPINKFRTTVSEFLKIQESQLIEFKNSLSLISHDIGVSAILSPSLIYESGRSDIIDLNFKLFSLSKKVGDDLGIPTIATAFIGRSATISEKTINSILSDITSLNSDGWYFGFEFNQERIPSNYEDILRFEECLLTLACTGKPILHAFSGPLSLISIAFGASGVALGHFQNLWQFSRVRWESTKSRGGSGDAPPRYFSRNLWGTIIYPDEFSQLPHYLLEKIISPTPFSFNINSSTITPWDRWNANKQFINIIGNTIKNQLELNSHQNKVDFAIKLLDNAIQLGNEINSLGISLKDNTFCYQENWKKAINDGFSIFQDDFEYLSLL